MGALTAEVLRRFRDDGYIVLRGVVSDEVLDKADHEIDDIEVGSTPPNEGTGGVGVNAWFLPPTSLPAALAALHESRAIALAQELVAPNMLGLAFDHIQISTTRSPWSHVPGGPHIDGHRPGEPVGSFTLLLGILLTDQSASQSGNLWVWPGSHLAHAQLFQERGVDALTASSGHSTWPEPLVELGAPEPILGTRGDIVLAHYLLGHNKGGNTKPHDRRTLYYRLAVPDHRARWRETFLDPWVEYPPVQAVSG